MTDTNKGIRKFLRILEKDGKKIETIIFDIINQKKQSAILNNLDASKKLSRKAYTEFLTEEVLKLLTDEEKELYDLYRIISTTLGIIKEGKAFNDFELLQDFFDKYQFERCYQLEVLGYILRSNINNFAETEQILKTDEKALGDSAKAYENFFAERLKELNIALSNGNAGLTIDFIRSPKFKERMELIFDAYHILDKYITAEGLFVPTQEIEGFYNALQQTRLKLTPEQKMLIVDDITRKRLNEILTTEFIFEDSQKEVAPSINFVDKKAKYQAAQVLKQYLEDEKPVKLIDDEEIVAITNALIELNYTDEQITKIQKGIIKNNNHLNHEQEKMDYSSAKDKYLSIEAIQVLDSVESLINSSETVINPLYEEIKNNFDFVKVELMKMYYANDDENPDTKYVLELINMAISEIRIAATSYCYSDYRFARELSKKGN